MVDQVAVPFPFMLNSIYVRSSNTNLDGSFNPTIPGQELAGEFRMTPSESPSIILVGQKDKPEVTLYSFVAKFDFRYSRKSPQKVGEEGSDPDETTSVCAAIGVEIAVEYVLQGDIVPDGDALKAFGTQAALNHAWPYWREFCHNAMVKMQLPVTMVPLLNLVQAPREQAGSETINPVAPSKKTRSKKKV